MLVAGTACTYSDDHCGLVSNVVVRLDCKVSDSVNSRDRHQHYKHNQGSFTGRALRILRADVPPSDPGNPNAEHGRQAQGSAQRSASGSGCETIGTNPMLSAERRRLTGPKLAPMHPVSRMTRAST
jgi:hypothetical protein